MYDTSRCREKTEGWLGRRRTYCCRECHLAFRVDTLDPLPEEKRICHQCKDGSPYTFTDKLNGEDIVVKGTDVIFATLRAHNINPHLTFKVEH